MKLVLTKEAIEAVIKPTKFSMIDILTITPRISVGQFEGCALNLAGNKTVIATNGIILAYNSLNDFLSGFDPISLVKDDSIYYDQEPAGLDFQIIQSVGTADGNEDFQPIRELMFGARDAVDEDQQIENHDTLAEN